MLKPSYSPSLYYVRIKKPRTKQPVVLQRVVSLSTQGGNRTRTSCDIGF